MSTYELPANGGWNLFAVELVAALPKDKTLRSLEAIVNTAIVQRLAESLLYQGKFTVLNARDLDKVVQLYQLGREVKRHLIAAIMATGIQQKLTERLDNATHGRAAAYAVLPIIDQALVDAEISGLSALVGLKGDAVMTPSADPMQLALDAIDRGIMALYVLDYMRTDVPDRLTTARDAYAEFTMALTNLERADRANPDWGYWHAEAAQNQRRAEEYGGDLSPI